MIDEKKAQKRNRRPKRKERGPAAPIGGNMRNPLYPPSEESLKAERRGKKGNRKTTGGPVCSKLRETASNQPNPRHSRYKGGRRTYTVSQWKWQKGEQIKSSKKETSWTAS